VKEHDARGKHDKQQAHRQQHWHPFFHPEIAWTPKSCDKLLPNAFYQRTKIEKGCLFGFVVVALSFVIKV
jgi:hypothetical protein